MKAYAAEKRDDSSKVHEFRGQRLAETERGQVVYAGKIQRAVCPPTYKVYMHYSVGGLGEAVVQGDLLLGLVQ